MMSARRVSISFEEPCVAEFVKEEHNSHSDIGSEDDVSEMKHKEEELQSFQTLYLPQWNDTVDSDVNDLDPLAIKKENLHDRAIGVDVENEVIASDPLVLTKEERSQRAVNFDVKDKVLLRKKCNSKVRENKHINSTSLTRNRTTRKKTYKCEVCKKSVSTSSYLRIHMKLHAGEKPYQCEVCNKSFLTSYYLTLHMRKHTGEKPYKCVECDKPFRTCSQLNVHRRLHTGNKPFKCDVCFKAFTQSSHLNVHMWLHTDAKMLLC